MEIPAPCLKLTFRSRPRVALRIKTPTLSCTLVPLERLGQIDSDTSAVPVVLRITVFTLSCLHIPLDCLRQTSRDAITIFVALLEVVLITVPALSC